MHGSSTLLERYAFSRRSHAHARAAAEFLSCAWKNTPWTVRNGPDELSNRKTNLARGAALNQELNTVSDPQNTNLRVPLACGQSEVPWNHLPAP